MNFAQKIRGERGTTSLEYCFLALLILLVSIAGVTYLGELTKASFEDPRLTQAF